MPDIELYARTAFGGSKPFTQDWDDFTIREFTNRSLASLAARHGRQEALSTAVTAAYGVVLPGPGRSVRGDAVSIDWMGPGQWFVEAERADGTAFARELAAGVDGSGSVTDQSDSWVQLDLWGGNSRAVLEKLCPLDLHPRVFTPGSVARTVMEHLGAIVALLEDTPRFKLLTARSSARSFLHSLRLAADSTCGPSMSS